MSRLNEAQLAFLRSERNRMVQGFLLELTTGLPVYRAPLGMASLSLVTAMFAVGCIVEEAIDPLNEAAIGVIRAFFFLMHDEPGILRDRIEVFLNNVDSLADREDDIPY